MKHLARLSLFTLLFGVVSFSAGAAQVTLDAAMANPFLKSDKKQTTFLKVGLTGFEMKSDKERPPLNIAVVIDRSGSMKGDKIKQAREAAKSALDRLGSRDILSVVAYDDDIEVIVPATKVSDKEAIRAKIDRIEADGSTALFAGVSKGAAELRKFIDKQRVNRVVLLSDGKANVGPSSPGELGQLGQKLVKEGISVSTIGLGDGYNEDLMDLLAKKSDGNHAYVQEPQDLAQIFKLEFGDALSVVAQEISVQITCAKGIRPVRLLGREGDIKGQKVTVLINQILSAQEKYVVLEVEVPAGKTDTSRPVADVKVSYANMKTKVTDELASKVAVRFSESDDAVTTKVNKPVMAQCITLVANDNNKKALALRDAGRNEEAIKLLTRNADMCEVAGKNLKCASLHQLGADNRKQAAWSDESVDPSAWNRYRKNIREGQNKLDLQRSY